MTRLSLHIALAALLLAPAAVLGQGASEDAQEDAPWHLLFSGRSWGLGSSSSTGDTILLLYEQLDAQGGSTRIVRSSHSLAAEGRFFLADAAGGPREVLAILRAKGNIKREVLRERVSAVISPTGRERSTPRLNGMMQNVHACEQP